MADDLAAAEAALFAQHDRGGEPSPVFILGSPRTGSTAFFQAMIAAFALPYISNLADRETPQHPIVGILRSHGQALVDFRSRYGKTEGPHAPAEGSGPMRHWCGGGHPSEIVSGRVLHERAAHMAATLRAVEGACGKPLLIKNAWNCFRVASLAETLPRAVFIWIRRDVVASARSDLAARYVVQGDPWVWNSATPRNVDELRALPPAAQVLENQREFARAIGDAASSLGPGRFAEVWYEDFCADPDSTLAALGALAPLVGLPRTPLAADAIVADEAGPSLSLADEQALAAHLAADPARWAPLQRT
jgi:hypothetical protein